jgi:glycosyltransferase 2 family protein
VNRPAAGRALKRLAAYLLAAAGLVWVFHDVDWAKLVKGIAGLDWRWVAPAILLDSLSYVGQGFRWRLLLEPLGRISALRTTQAVYAGLFINEVLPFHLGEIARAYPVSRWMAVSMVAIVPSIALERLFDGIWLAASFGVTAIFVPLPRDFVRAGDLFGLAVLVLSGIIVYVVARRAREPRERPAGTAPRPWPFRWAAANLRKIEAGLRAIGLSRLSAGAFSLSSLYVFLQTLSFWLIMRAYGLHLSFWVGSAVLLIVRFGTVLPGAPGNIGTYQLFCVLGLTLFGVEKTVAAGFSVVVFFILSVPLWALGSVALGRTGMTLASIRSVVRNQRDRA